MVQVREPTRRLPRSTYAHRNSGSRSDHGHGLHEVQLEGALHNLRAAALPGGQREAHYAAADRVANPALVPGRSARGVAGRATEGSVDPGTVSLDGGSGHR